MDSAQSYSLLKIFDREYDGMPAAWFKSANEARNVESGLRGEGISYRTKIHKSKKTGRQFIVMLVPKT